VIKNIFDLDVQTVTYDNSKTYEVYTSDTCEPSVPRTTVV